MIQRQYPLFAIALLCLVVVSTGCGVGDDRTTKDQIRTGEVSWRDLPAEEVTEEILIWAIRSGRIHPHSIPTHTNFPQVTKLMLEAWFMHERYLSSTEDLSLIPESEIDRELAITALTKAKNLLGIQQGHIPTHLLDMEMLTLYFEREKYRPRFCTNGEVGESEMWFPENLLPTLMEDENFFLWIGWTPHNASCLPDWALGDERVWNAYSRMEAQENRGTAFELISKYGTTKDLIKQIRRYPSVYEDIPNDSRTLESSLAAVQENPQLLKSVPWDMRKSHCQISEAALDAVDSGDEQARVQQETPVNCWPQLGFATVVYQQ
jgi:hypothetical protein